ncbi:baseplate J protein [Caulobacter sp. SLTY]|uniref:baseplate J/gp47 family protein n=1 Tax=Caulobacter sp. SLTY TaxID=2683262 RepID=UPI0014128367|nr:baseplate J/gp47 family protein [Caulobacter sp. SLTY]NBB17561.1 baseplate J protein [Caulobacter sp. SLTY]
MSWTRPTLSELIGRVETDLVGRLNGGLAAVRRSIERVVARVLAGVAHEMYGRLEEASRQLFPDTATGVHLERWAGVWQVVRKPAESASGPVVLTGTNGTEVPTGTRLQREDGAEYLTTADAEVAGGEVTLDVEAVVAGLAGNAEAGTPISLVSPIGGVSSEGVVDTGGLGGGVDQEADAALRTRLNERIREQPAGGSDADYKRWAKEVPGVTRAWVFPNRGGLGKVGVTFVRDGEDDIIPSGGELTAVEDYIEPRRPVTAELVVFAPTPVALNPVIGLTPDTAEVRAAVEAELKDLLAREAAVGADLLLTHIAEAISIAAGETDHELASPTADVAVDPEEIVVLGTIDWTP